MKHSQSTNWRVEVRPASSFNLRTANDSNRYRRYREACEEIATAIRRHVDDIEGATVEFDTEATCSHCGATWTEDSNTYNGGCCADDEKNNPTLPHDSDCSLYNAPALPTKECDCSLTLATGGPDARA